MSFAYDYSVFERWTGKGGKENTETRCSKCHEWHKGDYGFSFSCRTKGESEAMIVKLCPACEKVYCELLDKVCKELSFCWTEEEQ